MKKALSLILMGLIAFSMVSILAPEVEAQERVLFYDDFESYAVGSRPSPPWEFWFNTNGDITSTTYVSPTKSLRLLGATGWATEAIWRFASSSAKIGCEVYAKAESIGAAYESVFVGFLKRTGPTTAPWYASVTFLSDGNIYTHEGPIQPYVANVWYKIRIVFDRASNTYDVWIDDALKASSVRNIYSDPYAIEGFAVASGWASVNCYFDDAKVFEVSAPPKGRVKSYLVWGSLVSKDPISKKEFARFDYELSGETNGEIQIRGLLYTFAGYTELSIGIEEKGKWRGSLSMDWSPNSAFWYTYEYPQVFLINAVFRDLNAEVKSYRIVISLMYVSDFWQYPVDTHYNWRL